MSWTFYADPCVSVAAISGWCVDITPAIGYIDLINMRPRGGDVMEKFAQNLSCPEGWGRFCIMCGPQHGKVQQRRNSARNSLGTDAHFPGSRDLFMSNMAVQRLCLWKGATVNHQVMRILLAISILCASAPTLWSQTDGHAPVFSKGKYVAHGPRGSTYASLQKVASPSGVSVIDTAVILSTTDTTRHLYAFSANALRTSDIAQKLVGDVWTNFTRTTEVYDAGGRLISRLSEAR